MVVLIIISADTRLGLALELKKHKKEQKGLQHDANKKQNKHPQKMC